MPPTDNLERPNVAARFVSDDSMRLRAVKSRIPYVSTTLALPFPRRWGVLIVSALVLSAPAGAEMVDSMLWADTPTKASHPDTANATTSRSSADDEDDAPAKSSSQTPTPKKIEVPPQHRARVAIEGLDGDLEDNAEVYVKTATANQVTALSSFDRLRVERAIRDALSALGYFSPTIESDWDDSNEDDVVLRVKVDRGEPVTIEETDVKIVGAGEKEPFFTPIIKKLPEKDSVLNQSDYDNVKSDLLKAALNHGYFDAQFTEHQLGVQRATRKSYWKLTLATGERFKFGDVTFSGSQIDTALLEPIVPFKKGEPYTNESFSKLSENLNETGWFQTVVVVPETDKANEDREMPISATLVPRTKNTLDAGVGFSTDGGPHATLHWTRPWINEKGWSLEAETDINRDEPSAGVLLKMPMAENPLVHYWTVAADYEKTNLNDTESNQFEASVARHWKYETGWQREIHVKYLYNRYTQAGVSHTSSIVFPGILLERTRQRGEPFPYWGDTQRYGLDVAAKGFLSDVTFQRFTFHNAWIRTPWEGHRFIARATLGWLNTSNFDKIPPDLRFFAGGDRSIRGYDYKSVSPTDSQGRLTGAKYLATASVEYQKQVSGPWWGAFFIDAGEAVNTWSNVEWKVGFGAGVRWVSPIGPIKLDIAFPTDGGLGFSDLHLYFGLGSEL